eukprot:CAMPEP_0179122528 /NCGR_PEP_ID=MMETSP0796-20121207/57831_1 /TAXON_ID=73915 /ORGANISM="Pyrodinium bahamense, Strain pbaha01" /LENGTH=219 /DNA_ID=CAMNT_0020821151 /DNA_START=72 /DNA_END=729 /DNA_ORIENTATION=+
MTTYGSIKHGETQELRDQMDVAKPVLSMIGCFVVLPLLAFGITLTCLSATVPSTCTTNLNSVFVGLGVLHMIVAFFLCCGIGCIGSTMVDLWKHTMVAAHYKEAHRDAEADMEEHQAEEDIQGLVLGACPLICGVMAAFVIIFGFWIWGIVEAAQNAMEHVGPGRLSSGCSLAWCSSQSCAESAVPSERAVTAGAAPKQARPSACASMCSIAVGGAPQN